MRAFSVCSSMLLDAENFSIRTLKIQRGPSTAKGSQAWPYSYVSTIGRLPPEQAQAEPIEKPLVGERTRMLVAFEVWIHVLLQAARMKKSDHRDRAPIRVDLGHGDLRSTKVSHKRIFLCTLVGDWQVATQVLIGSIIPCPQ